MRSQQHRKLTHLQMAKHKLREQANIIRARKIPSERAEIIALLVAIQQPFLSLLGRIVVHHYTRGSAADVQWKCCQNSANA